MADRSSWAVASAGDRLDDAARFPPTARLRRPAEFRRVFGQPLRSTSTCLTVLARDNGDRGARLGLAIARKHLRRAVDRNRVKRIVRDEFRHERAELHGMDIVVLARRGLDPSDGALLRESLRKHWRRIVQLHRRAPEEN